MANRRARTAIRQGCNGKSASLGVWFGWDTMMNHREETKTARRGRAEADSLAS